MRRSHMRTLAWLLTAAPAMTAGAQSIFDVALRTAPQMVYYKAEAPSDLEIYQLVAPAFAVMPLGRRMTLDIGSAYAFVHAERKVSGGTTTSEISGPTDTQVRLNYTLGNDFVVLTAGANLPTGQSTAGTDEQMAATLIGSDFLAFPISNMGTGFGATAGLAIARPVGDWGFGAGFSVRRSEAYDPFEDGAGGRIRYQPGDEYRGRVGLDHPLGTGRVQLGLTYSRFGDDEAGGSLYNTGDRWLTQAALTNTVGVGDLTVVGWNLFRTAGTLQSGAISDRENITNALIGYGFDAFGIRVEPSVEGRTWTQQGAATSYMGTASLRLARQFGALNVSPSAGFTMGTLATESSGASTTADILGFRGALTIRIR